MSSPTRTASGGKPTRIGLPRPTGMAWALALFCLALLGAAINTGNNLLYLLFGLLTAAIPVSLGLSLLNLARLRARLDAPDVIQAGVPYTVVVHLHNHGRRAARGVRVRVFTAAGVLGPALVEKVPGGGEVQVTLTGCVSTRGPLRLLGVRLGAVIPLGLVERRRFFADPFTLMVLPQAPRRRLVDEDGRELHGPVPVPGGGQGQEYQGLRRGRAEDDVRTVDWKSSARRGMLLVRETAGEARPYMEFDLSCRRSGDPALARLAFEGEVSYHAGGARTVLEAGGDVRMTLDGGAPSTYSGVSGLAPLLRCLAQVEPVDGNGRPLPPPPMPSMPPSSGLPETPASRSLSRAALGALGIGAMALFAYDGLGTTAFLVLLAGLFFSARRGPGRRQPPTWAQMLWKTAGVLALLVFVGDLLIVRHNPLNASLNLIAFIALYKMFNTRDARDHRQMVLVSLLMIILAAALTTGVSFALPLLAWLTVVSYAQVAWAHLPVDRGQVCRPCHYQSAVSGPRYAMPTALAMLGMVSIGVLLFLAIPHLGTGTFAPGVLRSGTSSGFSETTRLGDIGRIKLNRSRVMQVRMPAGVDAGRDLKWRGMALDRFDGRSWTRTAAGLDWLGADGEGWFTTRGEPESPPHDANAGELVYQVRLDPSPQRVLFAAPSISRIRSDDFLFLAEDGTGAVFLPGRPGRGLSYTAASRLPTRDVSRLQQDGPRDPLRVQGLHLQLPPLDPRIHDLALQLTARARTRYDAAVAIETWLAENLTYSLGVADRNQEDPLAAFLFQGMAGHCEYFATGMVILARSAGIPARFVTGYQRGERSRFGPLYTVRQSDAHAWVEVYFPRTGWVAFDPTPPAGRGGWRDGNWRTLVADMTSNVARLWDDYVIGIDMDDQARGFLALRDMLVTTLARTGLERFTAAGRQLSPWIAGVIAAALLLWALMRVRGWRPLLLLPSSRTRGTPAFYRQLLRWLASRDLTLAQGETPGELAARAAGVLPGPAAARVRELTDLYYRVRYDHAGDSGSRVQARRLLADLRRTGRGDFTTAP